MLLEHENMSTSHRCRSADGHIFNGNRFGPPPPSAAQRKSSGHQAQATPLEGSWSIYVKSKGEKTCQVREKNMSGKTNEVENRGHENRPFEPEIDEQRCKKGAISGPC